MHADRHIDIPFILISTITTHKLHNPLHIYTHSIDALYLISSSIGFYRQFRKNVCKCEMLLSIFVFDVCIWLATARFDCVVYFMYFERAIRVTIERKLAVENEGKNDAIYISLGFVCCGRWFDVGTVYILSSWT